MLVAILSFAGLATYALYPAAPPWMASQAGLMPQVTRIIPLVWHYLGLHSAGSVVEGGYAYANNVAAVPSLHAAFSLLIAITLWPRKHKWLRPLVALYPLAMAFSLVYGAEHYFSDILLGWIYTIVVGAGGKGREPVVGGAARAARPGRLVPRRDGKSPNPTQSPRTPGPSRRGLARRHFGCGYDLAPVGGLLGNGAGKGVGEGVR